eukprot:gene24000-biopygen13415
MLHLFCSGLRCAVPVSVPVSDAPFRPQFRSHMRRSGLSSSLRPDADSARSAQGEARKQRQASLAQISRVSQAWPGPGRAGLNWADSYRARPCRIGPGRTVWHSMIS